MATTFNWVIKTLERETADGFVYKAHYDIFAADEVYSAHAYGTVDFKRHEELVPYDQLTNDIVIGWVKESFGGEEKVAEIEAALQQQLDEKRQPTRAAGVPWQVQQ